LAGNAETAGAEPSRLQASYLAIATSALKLQIFTAMATLRAGYWQNIQQKPVRDDYLVAGNLGYQYLIGPKDDLTEPPSDLPKDW
ncbi:MAG: hypothetical protein ACRER1_05705, partial [Gammaproteobacteria bacterium]